MKNQPHCADPTGSRHDGLDRCLVFRITKSAFEFCALPRAASPRGDPWLRNVEFGSMLTTGAQRRYLPSAASSPNAGVRRASGPPAVEYRNIFYGPAMMASYPGSLRFGLWVSEARRGAGLGGCASRLRASPHLQATAARREKLPRTQAAVVDPFRRLGAGRLGGALSYGICGTLRWQKWQNRKPGPRCGRRGAGTGE
jgi:hypothetical protein